MMIPDDGRGFDSQVLRGRFKAVSNASYKEENRCPLKTKSTTIANRYSTESRASKGSDYGASADLFPSRHEEGTGPHHLQMVRHGLPRPFVFAMEEVPLLALLVPTLRSMRRGTIFRRKFNISTKERHNRRTATSRSLTRQRPLQLVPNSDARSAECSRVFGACRRGGSECKLQKQFAAGQFHMTSCLTLSRKKALSPVRIRDKIEPFGPQSVVLG